MKKWDRFCLWLVRRILKRQIHRIAHEKHIGQDSHHHNSDCVFQLLEELQRLYAIEEKYKRTLAFFGIR